MTLKLKLPKAALAAALIATSAIANVSAAANSPVESEKLYVALTGKSHKALTALESKVNDLGVELLLAAPVPGSPMSMFGHALLRFVNTKGDPLNDLVVGVEAFTSGEIDYTKGLSGGYRLIPSVYSFNDALLRYQRFDSRAIRRIIVPTTVEARKVMLEEFKKMAFQPELFGDYKFISNNCVSSVLKIMEKAGLPIWLKSSDLPDIPAQAGDKLRNNVLAPFPELKVDSIASAISEWRRIFKAPAMEQSGTWSVENRSKLKPVSTKTIYILYASVLKLKPELRTMMAEELKERDFAKNFNELLGLKQLPAWMYQASADDRSCNQFQINDLKSRWSDKDLVMWSRRVQTQLTYLTTDAQRSSSTRSKDLLATPTTHTSACWTQKVLSTLEK